MKKLIIITLLVFVVLVLVVVIGTMLSLPYPESRVFMRAVTGVDMTPVHAHRMEQSCSACDVRYHNLRQEGGLWVKGDKQFVYYQVSYRARLAIIKRDNERRINR